MSSIIPRLILRRRTLAGNTYFGAVTETYKNLGYAKIIVVNLIIILVSGLIGYASGYDWYTMPILSTILLSVLNTWLWSPRLCMTLVALCLGYVFYPIFTYWGDFIDPRMGENFADLYKWSFVAACVVVAVVAWKTTIGNPAVTQLLSYFFGGILGILFFYIYRPLGLYSIFLGMGVIVYLRAGLLYDLKVKTVGLFEKKDKRKIDHRSRVLNQIVDIPVRSDEYLYVNARFLGMKNRVPTILLSRRGIFAIYGESFSGSIHIDDKTGIKINGSPIGEKMLVYRVRTRQVLKALQRGSYYANSIVVAHDTKMANPRWVDMSPYIVDTYYIDNAVVPLKKLKEFIDGRPNVYNDKEYKKLCKKFKRRIVSYDPQHSLPYLGARVRGTMSSENVETVRTVKDFGGEAKIEL